MGKLSKIKKNNCQNSYKHLVDKEYQHMLKSLRNDNSTYRFFTEGDFAHRRKTAVLSTLKFLESKLQSIDPDYGIEAFAEHSFVPYGNYEGLEQEKDLSLGAALWILGSLRRNNKLVEACEIISNYGVDYDDWYLPPNFSHPCFSSDLINSLVDIIKKRYSHTEHSGTIITLGNAKRIRPDKVYTQIIELLPKTEIEQACRTFKEKIYDVSLRFTKGAAYFLRQDSALYEENIKTLMSAVHSWGQNTSGVDINDLNDLSKADIFTQNIIRNEPERISNSFIANLTASKVGDLSSQLDIIMEKKGKFYMGFPKYLTLDKKEVFEDIKIQAIADCFDGFSISDPYELCFALFYLLDTGDDVPWLFNDGFSLMHCVMKMLPWYVDKTNWDSDDYDEWFFSDLTYNRNNWLEQKQPDAVNYFHIKHKGRNVTQLIYDLCHVVLPTGMHPFEKDRQRFIQEGMEEELANKITDLSEQLFFSEFQSQQIDLPDFDLPPDEEESDDFELEKTDSLNHEDFDKTEDGEWIKPEPIELDLDELNEEETEEDRIEDLTEQVVAYQNEVSSLKQQLKSLKKTLAVSRQEQLNEKSRYEHELKALRLEHRELADLREIVFNQNSDSEAQARREILEKTYSYPYSTRKRTVIFGGHASWLKVIKPMLPDVKFVDADQYAFNQDLIRNADVVWIQSNCMGHAQFSNIISKVRLYGVQLRYFGYSSAEKCAEQLVTEDLAS